MECFLFNLDHANIPSDLFSFETLTIDYLSKSSISLFVVLLEEVCQAFQNAGALHFSMFKTLYRGEKEYV